MKRAFLIFFLTFSIALLSQKKSRIIGSWELKYIYDIGKKQKREFPVCHSNIIFYSDTTFSTFGCCNTSMSTYRKTKLGEIKLFTGQAPSALVGCDLDGNKLNEEIISVLNCVKKYSVKADSLILFGDGLHEIHYIRSKTGVNIQPIKKQNINTWKYKKRQMLKSDSMLIDHLGIKGIRSTLGNFKTNDTVFYSDKSICRISRANKHGLNGKLEYFFKSGIKQLSFKYKNNERCDTSFIFYRGGELIMKEIIIDKYRTIIQTFYCTGQLGNQYISCVDKRFRDTGEFDWTNRDSPQWIEDNNYYDKAGNKISVQEFHKLYNGFRP